MTEAKKDALIEHALAHLLEHGLHDAGLRALAQRAQTSDRMLIYYFGSKDALIEAALMRQAERLEQALGVTIHRARCPADEVEALLLAQLSHPSYQPALTLLFEVVVQAARQRSPYPALARALQARLTTWIEARLDAPARARPPLARQILARVDGELLQQLVERAR